MLTNEIIYNGIPKISATIKEHRMKFPYTDREARTNWPVNLLLWYQNHGKRSRGRSAKTYIDQISMIQDAKEKNCKMQCKIEMGVENES